MITATQLRSVLGVSSALYDDTYLNQIIDTAETVILPMLVTFKAPIQATSLSDNVATFTTLGIHEFTEGQSVVITGCGSPYNGTRTVLADNLGQYTFSASITNAGISLKFMYSHSISLKQTSPTGATSRAMQFVFTH